MPRRTDGDNVLVERIRASHRRLVMATYGGGAAAAPLHSSPHTSPAVIDAHHFTSAPSLENFLRSVPDEIYSEQTARQMAITAYLMARAQTDNHEERAAGIGATASLLDDAPKPEMNFVFVAAQTARTTELWWLEMEKGRRSRQEGEEVAAAMLLNAAASACQIDQTVEVPILGGERIHYVRHEAPAAWTDLLLGRRPWAPAGSSGEKPPRIVFPGAFNPLHEGHQGIAAAAEAELGQPVCFEISIENVDKPPLDYLDLARRLAPLAENPVCLTRAPTFEQKAEIFPGAIFLVGIDTLNRIADPAYYGRSTERMKSAIRHLARQGNRFLVFGRLIEDTFLTLADIKIQDSLRQLCQEVPPERFRSDISSTELRRRQ